MDEQDLKLVNIKQLPRSLQDLIGCIGLKDTYALTAAFGGRPKYIPKHSQRTNLSTVISQDALVELSKYYGGVVIDIPKVDHFKRQLRNIQILKETSSALSHRKLADKYGLSLRQIGNICRQQH